MDFIIYLKITLKTGIYGTHFMGLDRLLSFTNRVYQVLLTGASLSGH